MTREAYVGRLAVIAGCGLILAALLHVVAGARWFGFYGVATVVLAVTPFAAAAIASRYRTLGFRRWPVVSLAIVVCLAAAIQIGYWLAFFSPGQQAILLGIVRTVLLDNAGPALTWLAAAIGVCLLAVIVRGIRLG